MLRDPWRTKIERESPMSDAAVQRFDLGRVISQTSGLIGRNFLPFFLLALLLSGLPYLIAMMVQPMLVSPDNAVASGLGAAAVILLLTVVPAFVLQGALTRAAIDDLGGRGVSLPNALQAGIRYILPLLGLAIVVGLGVMVGLILLVVPGIILAICWSVASPSVVVEKAGVFQAMQRSLNLTKGHRWAIFGLLMLYAVFVWVVAIVILLIFQGTVMPTPEMSANPNIVMTAVLAVVQAFEVMISTVGIAAIYFELRRIKEGVDVGELASVFD
jgi:hypothetical protein